MELAMMIKAVFKIMQAALLALSAPSAEAETPERAPVPLLTETYFSPVSARAGTRRFLVYELHLTNFFSADITIEAVNVLAGMAGSTRLWRFDSAALLRNARHIGPPPPASDKLVLAPGRRAVLFLWTPLPSGQPLPRQIRHHIELGLSGREQRYLVESTPKDVSQRAPLIISSPLRSGPWLAANAPRPEEVPLHNQLFYPRDGNILAPQRFATDWVKLDRTGRLYSGSVGSNRNWAGYGEEVLAVADGTVVATLSDVAENIPPEVNTPMTRRTVAGNHIVLDIGDGNYAFYGHLQPNSITIRPGDRVRRGQVIGRVGNSGNSTAPHLHFHVTDHPSVGQGEGVPFVLDRHRLLGRLEGTLEEMEAGARWRSSAPPQERPRDLPENNVVVQFP
jgi:murein DD-endopeptidase MepM/ murein hydrolase activator NlpD